MKGDARLKAEPFHPEMGLPATLPDGSHRVIKELTAAQMRAMMQGIVIEGTGKKSSVERLQLGRKKRAPRKRLIPQTHTYSHTKLVASFAGFAPVSDPAIAIAVVIDTPTAGGEDLHYGGAASGPVFAEIAQQVLEYLGVSARSAAEVQAADGGSQARARPGRRSERRRRDCRSECIV